MIDWLAGLVDPLTNTILFHLGEDAVSWAELLGFVTGGLCVWLTVRSHIANFPVGIANSAFLLIVFASSRLWADSALQVLFIALGVVGWWQWLRGGTARTALVVGKASRASLVLCLGLVVVGTAVLTVVLRESNDAAPFWDALIFALSIAAQYLLNAKKIENWWFWIAADCVSIPLYAVKRLDLTAIIYVVFLSLCIAGLSGWRRIHAAQSRPDAVPVPV